MNRQKLNQSDPLSTIVVSMFDIEAMNLKPALSALQELISTPELAAMNKENVDIAFSGIIHRVDELYEIQSVREFVFALDDKFPYWLYLLSKEKFGLQTILKCLLLPNLTDAAKAKHHPRQLQELMVTRWLPALEQILRYAGESQVEGDAMAQRSVDYFLHGPKVHPQPRQLEIDFEETMPTAVRVTELESAIERRDTDGDDDIIQNKWTAGNVQLVLPEPPRSLRKSGMRVQDATFDRSVGIESYISIVEEADPAAFIANMEPFFFHLHASLINTPHGAVMVLLGSVGPPPVAYTIYELYLNPQEVSNAELLARAARQTHIKVVIYDYQNMTAAAFYDLENVFDFMTISTAFDAAKSDNKRHDFSLARQYVMENYSVPELVELPVTGAA